jgi:hypothetical protein
MVMMLQLLFAAAVLAGAVFRTSCVDCLNRTNVFQGLLTLKL